MLWPYLLEFLVPEEYTNAITAVCQNLCYLAGKQRERDSENFTIDFVELGMLQSANFIIPSRLHLPMSSLFYNTECH